MKDYFKKTFFMPHQNLVTQLSIVMLRLHLAVLTTRNETWCL